MRSIETDERKRKTTREHYNQPRDNDINDGHLSAKRQYGRYDENQKVSDVVFALESPGTHYFTVVHGQWRS